jgi:hypothetical protein
MSSRSKARRDKLGGSLVILDYKNFHASDLTERRDVQHLTTPTGYRRRSPQSGQTVLGSQYRHGAHLPRRRHYETL